MSIEGETENRGFDIPTLPPLLSAALSRNIGAMTVFASMSDEQRQEIIDGVPSGASKKDMRRYVAKIPKMR